MSIEIARAFFMWCTILNGALLTFTFLVFVFAAEPVSQIHGRMFSISRETFGVVIYTFIIGYKMIWIVFNLVPWLALLLIG